MKVFKSIMLYLLLLIGLGIAAVLICCVLMICSPKTVIFGYRYVSYKGTDEHSISELDGVTALSITSNRMDIYIIPNSESNNIEVYYSQGMSGFVKEKDSDFVVTYETENTTFDSGDSEYAPDTEYYAVNINVLEPNGLVFVSDSHIKVYVPTNRTFAVINAQSKNGKIEYSSNAEGHTINVTNLYLNSQTKDGSKRAITLNKPNASRYYLKTGSGSCYLLNDDADISGEILFATSGGKLVAKNGAIKGNLTVRSSAKVSGANIDITKLYGDLNFYARSGNVSIAEIMKGTNSYHPSVDIQSEYCALKVTTLVGTITTQGYEGSDPGNIDVDIKTLTYVSGLSRTIDINSEAGNIKIGTLKGYATLTSLTGNITVGKAYNNMSIETANGEIDVTYDNTNACMLTELDISVLKYSHVTLMNVKGKIDITMTRDGNRLIYIGLHESVTDSSQTCEINIFAAGNNVEFENISSANFAFYSDSAITSQSALMTEIQQGNYDYDSHNNMVHQVRFNYSNALGKMYSKVYVHNSSGDTSNIVVNSKG